MGNYPSPFQTNPPRECVQIGKPEKESGFPWNPTPEPEKNEPSKRTDLPLEQPTNNPISAFYWVFVFPPEGIPTKKKNTRPPTRGGANPRTISASNSEATACAGRRLSSTMRSKSCASIRRLPTSDANDFARRRRGDESATTQTWPRDFSKVTPVFSGGLKGNRHVI